MAGFVFLGKGGLLRISVADNLVCNFLLLIVGFFEAVLISKKANLEDIINEINLNSKRDLIGVVIVVALKV
jgi:hypothetical protein